MQKSANISARCLTIALAPQYRKFDNLRDYRYEEIELFAKDPLKKVLYVSTYNTTGLNGGDDTHELGARIVRQKLDPKRIAKQYQALSARISPPYHWTMDWLADRIGAVRSFDGLNAQWMGSSLAPSARALAKAGLAVALSYDADGENAVQGFKKGSVVYLLDDPKGQDLGDGFVHEQGDAGPDDRQAQLARRCPQAAAGLEIPHRNAPKELVLEPKAGFAGIIQDDKGNLYHLTGPRQSNFVP